jgi:hypothetical protein
MEYLRTIAKAIVGFIAPGAVVLTSAVQAGSDGGTAITAGEWVTALCAAIITGAGVYAYPNTAPAKSPAPAQVDGRHEL